MLLASLLHVFIVGSNAFGRTVQGCWLHTPFASFPFTSHPVRRLVLSGSDCAISGYICLVKEAIEVGSQITLTETVAWYPVTDVLGRNTLQNEHLTPPTITHWFATNRDPKGSSRYMTWSDIRKIRFPGWQEQGWLSERCFTHRSTIWSDCYLEKIIILIPLTEFRMPAPNVFTKKNQDFFYLLFLSRKFKKKMCPIVT